MEKRNLWPFDILNLKCPKLKCFNCQITAKCKIYIQRYKCELYKTPRQYSRITTCTKNRRYDTYAYWKENCQYVEKKYYTIYRIKKRKCTNYKKLSLKYTTNGNFFSILNYCLLTNLINYCARHLLPVQLDFIFQKCKIERSITNLANKKHHLVMQYPKYYSKLNYIKHFCCNAKK